MHQELSHSSHLYIARGPCTYNPNVIWLCAEPYVNVTWYIDKLSDCFANWWLWTSSQYSRCQSLLDGAQMRLIRMVQHYTNQCANLLFIIPYCELIPSFVAKVQLCYTSIQSTSLVVHCVAMIKTWLKTHPRVHKKVIAMYRIQDFAQLLRRLTKTIWCQLSICAQSGYRILCSSLGSSQIVNML